VDKDRIFKLKMKHKSNGRKKSKRAGKKIKANEVRIYRQCDENDGNKCHS
jgi:hypothetical protein